MLTDQEMRELVSDPDHKDETMMAWEAVADAAVEWVPEALRRLEAGEDFSKVAAELLEGEFDDTVLDALFDDTLRTMVHTRASEQDMLRHARELGPSIREDGLRKVREGVTTIEEVLRVTREE